MRTRIKLYFACRRLEKLTRQLEQASGNAAIMLMATKSRLENFVALYEAHKTLSTKGNK